MNTDHTPHRFALKAVESRLHKVIEQEEGAYNNQKREQTDSLWSHLLRVAAMAEKIGRREGVDQTACRLAGLFHDAGKFINGRYHDGDAKEEDASVRILYEMTRAAGIRRDLVDTVAKAISQLYRGGDELSILARILFDADNLDKLGLPGVGNFLIKAGLRGGGLDRALLYRISVELTYARYAPETMLTDTGKELAAAKAPETIGFFRHFLDTLRNDGLLDFHAHVVRYHGVTLDIVETSGCACGGAMERKIWDVPGLKCRQINVEFACTDCGNVHDLHFCQPRLP